MITIDGLSVNYKGINALNKISLKIKKGEKIALLGQNGAGKSSLLKSLTGEIRPDSGNITLNGTVGILPEGASPYRGLKVYEYLEYIGALKGIGSPKLEVQRVISICQLEDKANSLTTTLSKGLTQRVMLGAALMGDPEIIILDEPSSGLDPLFQKVLLDIIKENVKDRTVIFSTHNISDAFDLADRVIVLRDGEISYNNQIDTGRKCILKFKGKAEKYPEGSTLISPDTIFLESREYMESVKKGLEWCNKENLELLEIKDSRDWSYLYEFF